MSYESFLVDKKDGIGVVTLNRPPANTYNFDLMRELDRVIEEVRVDEEINVVVLTGGGKFFSAGADIKMLKESKPQYKAMFCLHCQETLMELERIPKIVIAAINGHCVGGGLEIALACDLRFMGRDVGKIGLPEVTLGVLPGTGGTQRLPRLVGKSRGLELMITGKTLSPEEAKQIGLVNEVFDGDVLEETLAFARDLNQGAVRAIGLIKVAVQEGIEMPLAQAMALERELQNRLFITEDAKEGLNAFLEKRAPAFKGS
ncbi:MAG: enoyl-CoA hydratase/isomerase family protein [Acidobacteriota bacterium]